MKLPKMLCVLPLALAVVLSFQANGCDDAPEATTGVKKAVAVVATGTDGLTIEQRNVKDRLALDNKPGSIKHLYIISSMSGQVLLYSTVRGKVTSSGKRLTPYTSSGNLDNFTFNVNTPNGRFYTNEVLQDDGTYGDSVPYLYWWDVQGRYHQQYVTGGMILHISDQPIPVKSITLNLEQASN